MTPLPDGARVDHIPGNQSIDHDFADIWREWWAENRSRWDWLIDHFQHKGFDGIAAELQAASDPEQIHDALMKAESLAVEHELVAAEQEAYDLRADLPAQDHRQAVDDAKDQFYGV